MWSKVGLGVFFLFLTLYLMGAFSSKDKNATEKAKEGWSWLKRPEKSGTNVDWLDRRERVVEAFTLSWDAYERYAWGMCGFHTEI